MKLKIKQNILIKYLNYVIKGISTKNIRPILNCIKFDLTDKGLYLMSTNNELSIKTFIPKKEIEEITETGSIIISGRYIYEIVKKLPNEIINIEEVIDAKIYITTTNSSFTLNSNNIEEFPDLEIEYKKNPIILNQKVFKEIINQTSYATATGESRPVLLGINFKIYDNIIECTATDSYRLARKKIEINENQEEKINITIPNSSLQELIKLLSNEEDNIEMHVFNNKIIFKFDSIEMMCRLINGTYPDTSKLIPEEFVLQVKVKNTDLFSAIDRASLLTNLDDKNTIKFETEEDQANISSNIPEIGHVEEIVKINKNNNENIKISFNSNYMLDVIKVLESEEIELQFSGDFKPIIVKNPQSDDLIGLILPIRTY